MKDRGEREQEYAERTSGPNADLTSPQEEKGERRIGWEDPQTACM